MSKQILFEDKARRAVKGGIDKAAQAIKITLGPRGRNVIFDRSYGGPTITNDGVSIAKELSFKDKFENMGAELVKEVANKTNDMAGDGTTTSVVLFQAILEEGLKNTTMGVNPMGVRAGIEKASAQAVDILKKMAKKIAGKDEVKQVATISAESADIGVKIAETIDEVGKDGVVTVEESQSFGIETEVVEGMEFDKGYISHYMVTSPERMEADMRDPLILVTDKKVASVQEILPVLEQVARSGKKDLVIIADDVEGEALATFILNKLKGTFNVLAVKAPGYGDRKKEMLGDIATVVGGQVISEETGSKFESATLDMLGRASRVIASKDSTKIVGGKGKKADIDTRAKSLRKQLENTDSKFDKEKLEERIAKLSGGVAIIRVGAATETEMKYLKLKIEDAVNATKAAIAEGVVAGGGVALLKAAIELEKWIEAQKGKATRDIEVGYGIVLRALEVPIRQIALNAGKGDGSIIVEKIRNGKGNMGYDALKDEMVPDMLDAGIIDPVKVTRSGLQHAASAAAILLTTEAAIADEPEEKKDMPAMPPGGMGGMDY